MQACCQDNAYRPQKFSEQCIHERPRPGAWRRCLAAAASHRAESETAAADTPARVCWQTNKTRRKEMSTQCREGQETDRRPCRLELCTKLFVCVRTLVRGGGLLAHLGNAHRRYGRGMGPTGANPTRRILLIGTRQDKQNKQTENSSAEKKRRTTDSD
jgi:hypothetical protein